MAHQVHPKITLVNRRKYWDIGGCDEDFVGVYGFGDGALVLAVGINQTPTTPCLSLCSLVLE
jgi:hypothetical protein